MGSFKSPMCSYPSYTASAVCSALCELPAACCCVWCRSWTAASRTMWRRRAVNRAQHTEASSTSSSSRTPVPRCRWAGLSFHWLYDGASERPCRAMQCHPILRCSLDMASGPDGFWQRSAAQSPHPRQPAASMQRPGDLRNGLPLSWAGMGMCCVQVVRSNISGSAATCGAAIYFAAGLQSGSVQVRASGALHVRPYLPVHASTGPWPHPSWAGHAASKNGGPSQSAGPASACLRVLVHACRSMPAASTATRRR